MMNYLNKMLTLFIQNYLGNTLQYETFTIDIKQKNSLKFCK